MSNATLDQSRPSGTDDLLVHWARSGPLLRLALCGEADIATLDRLDSALNDVDLGGATSVHLDLSGLVFADVATIRRLAAFAGAARRAGHDVRTCGATRTLRKVATLLTVHDELGLA